MGLFVLHVEISEKVEDSQSFATCSDVVDVVVVNVVVVVVVVIEIGDRSVEAAVKVTVAVSAPSRRF